MTIPKPEIDNKSTKLTNQITILEEEKPFVISFQNNKINTTQLDSLASGSYKKFLKCLYTIGNDVCIINDLIASKRISCKRVSNEGSYTDLYNNLELDDQVYEIIGCGQDRLFFYPRFYPNIIYIISIENSHRKI